MTAQPARPLEQPSTHDVADDRPPATRTADPGDRVAAVHAQLIRAVTDLTAGEGWQQMLRTAAALPSYSPHNVLLITSQCPHARAVAGFHTWKAVGRSVRKGEKGLAILAPVLRSVRGRTGPDGDAPAPVTPEASATPTRIERLDGPATRRLTGFRVVHVFDISQTDGPELAEPPRPVLLDGQAPPGLLNGLTQQVHDQAFALVRHDFDVPHPGQDSPNGVTDYFARTVVLRPDLSAAQSSKTLAHELAHVLLHEPTRRPAALTREQAEVEAESVAYVVTAAHGLDSSGYTIPYVAGWSGGNLDLVARTAERVLSTSRDILSRTPPPASVALPEHAREQLRTRNHPRAEPETGRDATLRRTHTAGADLSGQGAARRVASLPPLLHDREPQREQGRLW